MSKPAIALVLSALFVAAGLFFFFADTGPDADEERWEEGLDRCLSRICWQEVPQLPFRAAVFRGQVMAPDDPRFTVQLFEERDLARGAKVLDIGTGAGLYALLAAQYGASEVVATDILPMAVANTVYNADLFGWGEVIEARLVPLSDPGAWSVMAPDERFDLVLCNPPGDDREIAVLQDFQDNDPGFRFVLSILEGLPQHVTPGGRLLLTYGNPPGLQVIQTRLKELGYRANIISSEGTEDFLTHTIRALEGDYERGEISPLLEIIPPPPPEPAPSPEQEPPTPSP